MTAMAQPASPLSIGSLTQLTLSLVAIAPLVLVHLRSAYADLPVGLLAARNLAP